MRSRIELNMSFSDIISAMSEGNPGAINVIMQMYKTSPIVDPDSALGGFGPILSLDSEGIYSSDIWRLYKYVCKESIVFTLAVLRANQLGVCDFKLSLLKMLDNPAGFDLDKIYRAVVERLPNFDRAEQTQSV